MRPKDLVMDLFGDYIRYMGGGIRLAQLVKLLALFGVEPATTRVTVSRMRRQGWLVAERIGRETIYTPTRRLTRVLDAGRERIFAPTQSPWTGQWTMVLYQIPEARRREREQLKRTLSWEGFGQLNPTTWLSPHEVRERTHEQLGCETDPTIRVLTVISGSWARDRELAQQCWNMEELATSYRLFIEEWQPVLSEGKAPLLDEEALRLRIKLVWDYRHFPFRDPNLPKVLQPQNWPGDKAYEVFMRVHQKLASQANSHVATMLTATQEPGGSPLAKA